MQQNITDPNQRFCYKCHYPANASDAKCPRCGGPLKTKGSIRMLGGVLVFLGGFISVLMIGVMLLMFGIFSQTPASKIKGEEAKVLWAIGVVALTFGVGVSFAIAGLWQMIFGKRNKWIVWISIALVVFLLIAGRIFTNIT
jgi:sterol desaturase/sphingolipid hydroxylase (fatty acid hydroxylase superfamily)